MKVNVVVQLLYRFQTNSGCPYFIIKFWQHFVFKCETIMMRVQIETVCFQLRFWD